MTGEKEDVSCVKKRVTRLEIVRKETFLKEDLEDQDHTVMTQEIEDLEVKIEIEEGEIGALTQGTREVNQVRAHGKKEDVVEMVEVT